MLIHKHRQHSGGRLPCVIVRLYRIKAVVSSALHRLTGISASHLCRSVAEEITAQSSIFRPRRLVIADPHDPVQGWEP
jgi:hypothetical protein